MKKIFSIAILFVLTTSALVLSSTKTSAQSLLPQTDPAGAVSTVNTNGDTSYHSVDLAGNTFNYNTMTFAIKGTKTSGTVAGACTLWGSMDNSRWYPVYGASTNALADTVTTKSLTDGDVDFAFYVRNVWFRYYRVRVITTGTQVSTYAVRLLGRKFPY